MNSPSDDSRNDVEPLLLRAPADIRRAFSWFAYASLPIGVLAFASVYYLQHRGFWDALVGSALIALLFFLLGLWPQRWAVRVDSQGVATRRFFGWKCLSWADIASGRIEKRLYHVLYDPQKPFWRRELELGLAGKETRRAMEVINRYYVLPPPPDLPEQLKIRYGFRRVAVLDAQGIHLRRKGELREYTWRDVKRLHITRPDSVRRDFSRLELYLPDETIELQGLSGAKGKSSRLLSTNVRCDLVDTFLRKHVPEVRTDCDVSEERPAQRGDLERQIAKIQKDWRNRDRDMCVIGLLLLGMMGWMAITRSIIGALIMTALTAGYLVPLYLVSRRTVHARIKELECQLASFDTPQEAYQGSPTVELP